jgi:hypothetical protein
MVAAQSIIAAREIVGSILIMLRQILANLVLGKMLSRILQRDCTADRPQPALMPLLEIRRIAASKLKPSANWTI